MKKIDTKDAVGHVLCHDITKITTDEKGVAFPKGHVVKEEDIEILHSLGKFNLYVWEKQEGMLHENEAAYILRDICQNQYLEPSDVKEGKIEFKAQIDGLFCVDIEKLAAINSIGQICIATRHNYSPVLKGDRLAGTRVVPLVIEEEKMEKAKAIAKGVPILSLLPYKPLKAGIITTGSEVKKGIIKDSFTPVVEKKLSQYGITVICHEIVEDKKSEIVKAIANLRLNKADFILCTGGMSVDPDDLTPGAIAESGADIVCYGTPILPGSMFLLGYFEDKVPIAGLPGCVMYEANTVFDLALPRIAAGSIMEHRDFALMGHGGLCLQCNSCHYPHCSFGKGS